MPQLFSNDSSVPMSGGLSDNVGFELDGLSLVIMVFFLSMRLVVLAEPCPGSMRSATVV